MAPRIQALYHCFNKHYLLLRIGQLAREFATFDLPGTESTNEQAMQALIIRYNHFSSPLHKVMKYWAGYQVYQKIQVLIQEKLGEKSNAPGNPRNIATRQAITEFATLESQIMDSKQGLKKLNMNPAIKKWKAVYTLGQQLTRFVDVFGESALWVIPFDAIEAALGRGLDTANTIYILTILNFLAQTNEVATFLKELGKSVHDQLVDLTKAAAKDRVSALMHVEAELADFASSNYIARSKAQLNVIGFTTISELSQVALRSSFASNGSESVCLRDGEKMPINASEIEFLEPRRQLSDLVIDHALRMMKADSYYIVSSAAFEAIRGHGETGFWDRNDEHAKMGYIVPIHVNLAVLANDEDAQESDGEASHHSEADLPEHFVLAHIRRSDTASSIFQGPDLRFWQRR
ncbi:hypothetical protein KJ359_006215 [Pestalotiopsis sp. 9143b]|nr:hypothetical protein KJ359_006215 [Pestalotiopsis sp. 9143b]